MGWFGHGKYDGDDTASIQSYFLEYVLGDSESQLLTAQHKLIDINDFVSGKTTLDPSLVNYLHTALICNSLVRKEMVPTSVRDESDALQIMMIADFFLCQCFWSPDLDVLLIENGKLQTSLEILREEAQEFDSPRKRLNVLKKFETQLATLRNNYQ